MRSYCAIPLCAPRAKHHYQELSRLILSKEKSTELHKVLRICCSSRVDQNCVGKNERKAAASYSIIFHTFQCHRQFLFLCFSDLENMSSKVSESTHSTGSCAFSNQCLGAGWGELTFAADRTICRSNVVCQLGNTTVGKGAGLDL